MDMTEFSLYIGSEPPMDSTGSNVEPSAWDHNLRVHQVIERILQVTTGTVPMLSNEELYIVVGKHGERDPHGPYPLPDDPFMHLETDELHDLIEAIDFAVEGVPREQRRRYADLRERANAAVRWHTTQQRDPNIMAMNLERESNDLAQGLADLAQGLADIRREFDATESTLTDLENRVRDLEQQPIGETS